MDEFRTGRAAGNEAVGKEKRMKKLDREMDSQEFLRVVIKKYPNLAICLNCPHPNGECVEFARQGKCKAFD